MAQLGTMYKVKADKAAEALHDGYQLTDKDIKQLAMRDEDYKLQTWDVLKKIIEENRLEDLTRVPSDLKRYIAWSRATREEYGTIQAFVLKERLGWKDLNPENPIPFACESDTKILINDWPYGTAPGILHIVCWTKAPIPTLPDGHLTPSSHELLEKFVYNKFSQYLGEENVLWFKNWASIQSVRSVEHIHVLVRGPTHKFLEEVVGVEANGQRRRGIGEMEREREEGENNREQEK